MKNSTNARIMGIGEVVLKFTSGNTITLKNVNHMPNVRKNLVSESWLDKEWFKLMFESNTVVILKNNMYISKWYVYDGLFKHNTLECVNTKSNYHSFDIWSVEAFDVWHERLGHGNSRTINRMVNPDLVLK